MLDGPNSKRPFSSPPLLVIISIRLLTDLREMERVLIRLRQSLIIFCCYWCCFHHPFVSAQLPIPARYDGFAFKGSPSLGESVLVEAFFDPLCPDSRDSWLPLKQVLQYYSPNRVSLIIHPFPLPYHNNAYLASHALHIANKLNASSTYPLLELFFKYQEKYYNAPTYSMTRASIVDDMVHLATKAVGENLHSAFKAGYNDSQTESATRISFKYGCSRGVTGTPSFFVNGIPIPDFDSANEYQKWRSILDPLLGKQQE